MEGEAGKKLSGFNRTLERRWFIQFFVSIFICITNGACFCFGIFSPFMKEGAFKYNQSQINAISTVGVILSYFSLPTGFLFDKKGPKVTLLIGAILNAIGWLGMALFFMDMEHPWLSNNISVVIIFYGISQFSSTFFETGSVMTNLDSFSCYRGRVIIIQKTFMGLGSSIIVQIYIAYFDSRFSTIGPFFIFLLIYSFTVGILGTIFVRLPTDETRCLGLNVANQEQILHGGEPTLFDRPFNLGTVILVISIFYVLAVTLVENYVQVTDFDRQIIGICTIAICLSFALMIVVTPSYSVNVGGFKGNRMESVEPNASLREQINDSTLRFSSKNQKECSTDDSDKPLNMKELDPKLEHKSGLIVIKVNDANHESNIVTGSPTSDPPFNVQNGAVLDSVDAYGRPTSEEIVLNERSMWENMKTLDLWLLWFICFASWSSATVVSTNSSQIYAALDFDDYSSTVNTVYVSIYGVASAIGRVIIGVAHPIMLRKKYPIAAFTISAPIINMIGLPLFLCMSKALYVPFFLIGLATGVSWGSVILIIKSLFSSNNCGKHYSFLYTAGILSPIVFNIGMFGPIYDYYSKVQGLYDLRQCRGRQCIWIQLLAVAVVNVLAIPCAILFTVRTTRQKGIR